MTNTTNKTRIVFYARVSTEHEAQLNAFENQIDWYKAELLKHPEWEFVDIYSDKGITGTSVKKRKGFMQMYTDAHLGKFDKIVTRELSRFARNIEEAYEYARKFEQCGVSILFLNDNIDTANAEDMTIRFALMASMAQEESRKVSARSKDGQKTSMANGVYYGNGNILGYDRYESKAPGAKKQVWFEINAEQARTVRMIYDMYLSGMGLSLIKDELERQGRLTSQGKTNWHESNISKILKNSFYCGTITYHKEYVKSYLSQKRLKNRGEIEFIQVEGTHTPIVTKEEFERVQKIMSDRTTELTKDRIGKKPFADVWAKLLRCTCGHGVNRIHYSGKGENKKVAYRCSEVIHNGTPENRKRKGLPHEGYCATPMVQQWKLEFMANQIFRDFLPQKDAVVDLAVKMLTQYLKSSNEDKSREIELERKKAELETLKKRQEKNLEYLLDGTLDKLVYKSTETKLTESAVKVSAEIEALEKELSQNNTKEDFEERIKRLKAMLTDYTDFSNPKEKIPEKVVEAFVKSIIICDDHFEWYLRTDGSETPIACTVQGREKDKEFTLSSSFSPLSVFSPVSYPPRRLLSRTANCIKKNRGQTSSVFLLYPKTTSPTIAVRSFSLFRDQIGIGVRNSLPLTQIGGGDACRCSGVGAAVV